MKKALFSLLSATALLCSTSCSDDAIVSEAGGEALVQFSVELNDGGVASRAISDGELATDLFYEVYATKTVNGKVVLDENPQPLKDLDVLKKNAFAENGQCNINLALVKGQTYYVVFWAQYPEAYVKSVSENLTEIDVTPYLANDKRRDAFTAVKEITVTGANSYYIELTRPFAQVNFGTLRTDMEAAEAAGAVLRESSITVTNAAEKFNALKQEGVGCIETATFGLAKILDRDAEELEIAENQPSYEYLATAYVMYPGKASEKSTSDLTLTVPTQLNCDVVITVPNAPVQCNYRTNVLGNLLTNQTDFTVVVDAKFNEDDKYGAIDGEVYYKVDNATEFADAFTKGVDVIILNEDVNLNELQARSEEDPTYTIANGKTLTIDLNGKKLSATSKVSSGNREIFLVKGTLNVKNGTIEYEHKGENMGWNAMTTIFDVTAGGVLNLEGVTAKNLGGSDMGFVAHLNNWGEVTLNAENCTLESNYVPVRVFNSGFDMNNVDIKNSTLKGGNYAFWVHNYTVADFGSEDKAEAQKALLNLKIYNQGNKFTPDVNGIRYGMTNKITTDAYGITKSVSADGTEVTLGSVVENGVIRRGVAGAEENTTIKKVVVEEGVAVLYDRTFRRFYALEEVVLPEGLTTIGAAGSGVFQSCSNLKTIVLPESVTVLGNGSFQECTSLESINIPAGVTRIEENALRNTGLKEVEFHAGVTYFGAQAFRDCKQLTKVVINAPEFTMEGNTFGIMAAPYTPMTIEVVNAEMKAYVESKLTAHAKTYITVECPKEVGTAEELAKAIKDGGNYVLVNDIAMTAATYQNVNFTLDGNGYTISQAEGSKNEFGLFDSVTGKITLRNVKFAGVKGGAVIRTTGAELTMDNVTVTNCEHTQIYGLFRLIGKNVIKNCKFENNKCTTVITFNTEGDDNTDPQLVQNCEFKNNTCSTTAVVHYSTGGSATIDGNKFLNNELKVSNGATLYMGFKKNCTVTNNVFDGNKVTATSKRSSGGLMIGNAAVVTGNCFVNNTVTVNGQTGYGNDVCASPYYAAIDLSGNYWGGGAPVENDDYYKEYNNYEVIINDYLTTWGE